MQLPWAYFDTSTFLKLYVQEIETGSARTQARKSRIISSALLVIECFSALSRKRQSKEIGSKGFEKIVNQIRKDASYMEIIRLTDEVLLKAETVALQSNARALDAIHIASAIIFRDSAHIDLTFITSDKKQQEAAHQQGLKTCFVG